MFRVAFLGRLPMPNNVMPSMLMDQLGWLTAGGLAGAAVRTVSPISRCLGHWPRPSTVARAPVAGFLTRG